jgi:hypothetical protein
VGGDQQTPRGAGLQSPESGVGTGRRVAGVRRGREKHALRDHIIGNKPRHRLGDPDHDGDHNHVGGVEYVVYAIAQPPCGAGALSHAQGIKCVLIEVPSGAQALGVLERAERLLGLWSHAAVNSARIEAYGL